VTTLTRWPSSIAAAYDDRSSPGQAGEIASEYQVGPRRVAAVCGCADDSARFPCAVAQPVDEQVEEATGLLALRWLAGCQGHAAEPQEHVVGLDLRGVGTSSRRRGPPPAPPAALAAPTSLRVQPMARGASRSWMTRDRDKEASRPRQANLGHAVRTSTSEPARRVWRARLDTEGGN
jgi:hypothetical protein